MPSSFSIQHLLAALTVVAVIPPTMALGHIRPTGAAPPAPAAPAPGNGSATPPPPDAPAAPQVIQAQRNEADGSRTPPEGLLSPITADGGLPRIYGKLADLSADELAHRAKARDYKKQIAKIRHEHFGEIRAPEKRQAGIAQLMEFTDPAAFAPMIEALSHEADDVRLAMLDHFAAHEEPGQGALAWVAIQHDDPALRNEALKRLTSPASEPVLRLVDRGLRSDDHDLANASAAVASALNITQAIPLLIFAQAQADGPAEENTGDLAYIAIQTQQAYVQNLIPVAGDGAGAFQPVIGIVSDGVVMRVHDAVVISYRTVVHNSLVALATMETGEPTEAMGYNVQAWWDWYNNVYVPMKNEQAMQAALASDPPPAR